MLVEDAVVAEVCEPRKGRDACDETMVNVIYTNVILRVMKRENRRVFLMIRKKAVVKGGSVQ
jgi:hypothetical protein